MELLSLLPDTVLQVEVAAAAEEHNWIAQNALSLQEVSLAQAEVAVVATVEVAAVVAAADTAEEVEAAVDMDVKKSIIAE